MGFRSGVVVVAGSLAVAALAGCPHEEDLIIDAAGTCTPDDDGNPCTLDECVDDVQSHTPRTGETCPGGVCTATAMCMSSTCGNGVTEGEEECDDANEEPIDGCIGCRFEPTEIEPNQDATVDEGGTGIDGNDFDATAVARADANAATLRFDVALGDLSVRGGLMPHGDEDVYQLKNTTTVAQTVKIETWHGIIGWNASCGISIDLGLNLRDASGALLASNDDRNAASDRCSSLTYTLPAGAVVYVQITEAGDNALVQSYGLTVLPP
mgnify:CR=1 FL=1